jgi:Tfp pilus assembly protein PilN
VVRVNLLPPEIIERRKYERFYPYVIIIGLILVAVVLVVWFGLQLAVNQRNDALQQTKSSTQQLQAQAESFAVFERKQQELQQRQAIVDTALAGRIDMGRLAEDISLVLPSDVCAESLACNQQTGLTLGGYVPISSKPLVADGYKDVAAALVRLAALEQIKDVWLASAAIGRTNGPFEPAERTTDVSGTVMNFLATGDIAPAPSGGGE